MRFEPTALVGVWLVRPEPHEDARGSFAQTFNLWEFEGRGLCASFVVTALSANRRAGTLRGLHFQAPPHAEAKLVSCPRGRAFDVVVDLRRASPTHGRWVSAEISEADGTQIYIPEGCAHGFQTLADDTKVHYQLSVDYAPDFARGVRWDDPDLAIAWPRMPTAISDRDRALPAFAELLVGA